MYNNNNLVSEFLLGRVSIALPSGKVIQIEAPVYGLLSESDLRFLNVKEEEETA